MADSVVPALKKTLSFFRSSRSLPLTLFCPMPIVRRKDREHLFVRKENEVSGILKELLKQKHSALHASSAVRVCQLLCTAHLETFKVQVLTNNLGYRRPMNTRLPWLSHGQSRMSAACPIDSGLIHKLSQRFLQCGHKLMVKVNKQKNSDTKNLYYNFA